MLKTILTLFGNKRDSDITDSTALFRMLFRHSPFSIEIYDKNGLQMDVNPAYERFWKVYGESTVGKYNILQDERLYGTPLLDSLVEVYEKEYIVSFKHDFSLPSLLPGTGMKKVKTTVIPVKDMLGELEQVMVLHQDLEQRDLPATLSVAS